MACYEFGFPIGTVSRTRQHTKNVLTNVALDPEVHAHWRLIDFEATGISGRIAVLAYRSNWTVRAGARAYREVARARNLIERFFNKIGQYRDTIPKAGGQGHVRISNRATWQVLRSGSD